MKSAPQGFHIDLQGAGRLGGIDHKGHPGLPAQSGHFLHRQDIAEHIGNMGKNCRLRPFLQGLMKGFQGILPVKKLSSCHGKPCPQGSQGPDHRIVLKAGNRHPCPRFYQRTDGNVQAVGTACGQHHLLRLAGKKCPCRLPASVNLPGSLQGCRVTAPARIGTAAQSFLHRPVDPGRLVKRGGPIVQVDHTLSASSSPSLRWA